MNQLHVSVTSEKTPNERLYLAGGGLKRRPVLGRQASEYEGRDSQSEWAAGEGGAESGYLALGVAGVDD